MTHSYVRILREAERGGEGKERGGEKQGGRKGEERGKGELQKHEDASKSAERGANYPT